MAANMYDVGVPVPIMDTYVPINFDALYKIGAAQKEAVDKAYADLSTKLQKWSEFTSPSDVDIKNWYKNTVGNPVLSGLLEYGAANPDALKDSAYRGSLQSAINSLDYTALSRLKQGSENLKTREKIRAELEAKGLYKYSWDVYRDKEGRLQQFNAANWDTLNQGILDQLSPVQYQSLFDIVNPYVKDLKPTFYEGNVNPLTGRSMSFVKGYNAITRETINDLLDRNINEIMNNPQGQLWYRDIAQAVTAANPDATQEDINNAFVENLRKNAYYKLTASPVDDEYAMKAALQQQEYNLRKKLKGEEEKQTHQPLSLEDILATQNAQMLKNNVASMRSISPEFAQKYGQQYDDASQKINTALETAMNNEEFKSLDKNLVNDYVSQQSRIQQLVDDETQEATGRILQRRFNATLGKDEDHLFDNPFEGIRTQLRSGEMYQDETLVHQMYEDGLHDITVPIAPQTRLQLESHMFSDKKISPELGYSYVPSGKLISPKKFISNNKYISNLAGEAKYDINKTHLNRASWSGDQNFDVEEKVAKGEFGNVAISEIVGYIDTPGERGYVVKVNIPLKAVLDKYRGLLSTDGNVRDNLDKTYQITRETGDEDSDDLPGRWKDGYITTTMVMPVSSTDLDRTQNNRLWQNTVGVAETKKAQSSTDDYYLQQFKNYNATFGLNK